MTASDVEDLYREQLAMQQHQAAAAADQTDIQAMLNDVEAVQRMFADLKSAGLREEEEEEAAGPAKASSSPGKHELIHESLVRDLSIVGLAVQGVGGDRRRVYQVAFPS